MNNAARLPQTFSISAPHSSKEAPLPNLAVPWLGGMSYGTPELDKLHQALLKEMEKFSASTDEEFGEIFRMFLACIESTFRQEEQWMEDIDFPMLKQHQEQHARVLAALHNVQAHVATGNLGLGREATAELLPQWLTFHMSTMDTALSVAMQIAQAETEEAQQWMQKHAALSWPF